MEDPVCSGCGEYPHPNFPCAEASALRADPVSDNDSDSFFADMAELDESDLDSILAGANQDEVISWEEGAKIMDGIVKIYGSFVDAARKVESSLKKEGWSHAIWCNYQAPGADFCNCGLANILSALEKHEELKEASVEYIEKATKAVEAAKFEKEHLTELVVPEISLPEEDAVDDHSSGMHFKTCAENPKEHCAVCGSCYPRKYVFFGKRICINNNCRQNKEDHGN
jgi:hypothetical protein